MADVINLNRFRKRMAAEERAARADANRRRHGMSRAERDAAERERERERERDADDLAGKRLDRGPAGRGEPDPET